MAGRTGSRGMAAYAAAKAGVTALTQSLGAEWAKYGITGQRGGAGAGRDGGRARGVEDARDDRQRLSRGAAAAAWAVPEEIAWAVIFVASDQAQFMTGETMYVSGGPRVANRED